MFRYTVTLFSFGHPSVQIILSPVPAEKVTSIWDFVRFEVPARAILFDPDAPEQPDNMDEEFFVLTFTCNARAEGMIAVAAHLGDLTDLRTVTTQTLFILKDEIAGDGWLDHQNDGGPDAEGSDRDRTYNALRSKAQHWDDEIDEILSRRESYCMRPSARPRPGFVYLLRSPTSFWKIGRAANPADRLKTFGVQLPFEVEYEHLIPVSDMVAAELYLHNQFAHRRTKGEWFALTDADILEIKAIDRM